MGPTSLWKWPLSKVHQPVPFPLNAQPSGKWLWRWWQWPRVVGGKKKSRKPCHHGCVTNTSSIKSYQGAGAKWRFLVVYCVILYWITTILIWFPAAYWYIDFFNSKPCITLITLAFFRYYLFNTLPFIEAYLLTHLRLLNYPACTKAAPVCKVASLVKIPNTLI